METPDIVFNEIFKYTGITRKRMFDLSALTYQHSTNEDYDMYHDPIPPLILDIYDALFNNGPFCTDDLIYWGLLARLW